MELRGLGYPAIICKDMQASIDFYEKLGMRRLFMEPNRDDPDSVQVLLHAGGEDYLLLVGPNREGINIAESSPGVGSMQYLTLQVSGEFIDQAYFRLSSAGLQASEEIRRGYERLVFLEDPNQVLEPPDISRHDWGPRSAGRRCDKRVKATDRATSGPALVYESGVLSSSLTVEGENTPGEEHPERSFKRPAQITSSPSFRQAPNPGSQLCFRDGCHKEVTQRPGIHPGDHARMRGIAHEL